jgi:hypothetical protein
MHEWTVEMASTREAGSQVYLKLQHWGCKTLLLKRITKLVQTMKQNVQPSGNIQADDGA